MGGLNEFIEENQGNLTEEDEGILLWATLATAYAIDIFVVRLEQQITQLRQSGLTDTGIAESLRRDLGGRGRIFGELDNSIRRGIISGVMQGSRLGQDRIYGNNLMKWVTVGSPKLCDDCKSRIGQVATWEDWVGMGLPATGWSRCREFCYCQLIPSDIPMPDRLEI